MDNINVTPEPPMDNIGIPEWANQWDRLHMPSVQLAANRDILQFPETMSEYSLLEWLKHWLYKLNVDLGTANTTIDDLINKFNQLIDELPTTIQADITTTMNNMLSDGDFNSIFDNYFSTLDKSLSDYIAKVNAETGDLSKFVRKTEPTFVENLNKEFSDRAYNVRWYGALGDGKTDDSTAFLLAIADAKANNGIVYVPNGNYLITKTIVVKNFTIVGENKFNTLLFPENVTTFINLDDGSRLENIGISDDKNLIGCNYIWITGSNTNIRDVEMYHNTNNNVVANAILFMDSLKSATNPKAMWQNTIENVRIISFTNSFTISSANNAWVNGNVLKNIHIMNPITNALLLISEPAQVFEQGNLPGQATNNPSSISQNIFKDIEIAFEGASTALTNGLNIGYGTNNVYDHIHTWNDSGLANPAAPISLAMVDNDNLRNNVFSKCTFETDIKLDDDIQNFNDLTGIISNIWDTSDFGGGTLHGKGVNRPKNIIASDIVQMYANGLITGNKTSPIVFTGIDLSTVSPAYTPTLGIKTTSTSGSILANLNREQTLTAANSQYVTVDVEFYTTDSVRHIPIQMFGFTSRDNGFGNYVTFENGNVELITKHSGHYAIRGYVNIVYDNQNPFVNLGFKYANAQNGITVTKISVLEGRVGASNDYDESHSGEIHTASVTSTPTGWGGLGLGYSTIVGVSTPYDQNKLIINSSGKQIIYPIYY